MVLQRSRTNRIYPSSVCLSVYRISSRDCGGWEVPVGKLETQENCFCFLSTSEGLRTRRTSGVSSSPRPGEDWCLHSGSQNRQNSLLFSLCVLFRPLIDYAPIQSLMKSTLIRGYNLLSLVISLGNQSISQNIYLPSWVDEKSHMYYGVSVYVYVW